MIGRLIVVLRIGAVLAVAVGAGHLVQTLRPGLQETAATTATPSAEDSPSLPRLAGITAVSASADDSSAACPMQMELSVLPAATIAISLSAPCHSGERVVVRHAGLAFSQTLGAEGRMQAQFPALEKNAVVAAYVGSSGFVVGEVEVAEVVDYLRLAVQMPPTAKFDLRADEGGQVFIARTAMPGGEAQRITALGQSGMDDPLLSQVYSTALRDLSLPDLSVDLQITPDSCGRTLSADLILSLYGEVSSSVRKIEVPFCGTSGDILVLKNLLPDLTLASPE